MTDTNNNHVEFPRRLRWVRLADLHISVRAQRDFNQAWADHLYSEFDPEKFEPPHVNERDGRLYVVDGQHRLDALKRWLGQDWEDQEIQAWTYQFATEDLEAGLFLHLSRNRKPLKAFEDFRIALAAKEALETDIERLVIANGQKISRDNHSGISATGALKAAYRETNPSSFSAMIRINGTWGNPGFRSETIRGIALFVDRYNGLIDEDRAIERFGSYHQGVIGFLQDAALLREKLGQPLYQCVAATAVDAYNRGATKAQKLPGWW